MNNFIDDKTLQVLKKGDRYLMFRLLIHISHDEHFKVQVIKRMLDQIPELDFQQIDIWPTRRAV